MPTRARTRALLPLLALALTAACGPGEAGDGEPAGDAGGAAADAPPFAELPNPFRQIQHWGELPDGRGWGSVTAVASDPDGENVWVAERCGANSCVGSDVRAVLRFDGEGQVRTAFGADLFVRPHGIDVDSAGNVWVTDDRGAIEEELDGFPDAADKGHRVIKFSPEGEILMTLGTAGEPGDPPDHLTRPADVLAAPSGDVYVAEGHSDDSAPARISKFSADGEFLTSWGTLGSGPGQFRTAHALAMDSRGRIYVADRGNNRVQIFDRDGGFIAEWHQFGRPNDVLIEPDGTIYVVDAQSDQETNPGMRRGIYIGDVADGEVTAFVPAVESYNPSGSEGLGIDAGGSLYVGEIGVPGMTKYVPR